MQWSVYSDGRIKKDVTENVKGLDFILKLRPVTYRLDMAAIDRKKVEQGVVRTAAMKDNPSENETRRFTGFIAQEVDKASQASGYDFSGVEKPKDEKDLYRLRYAEFVVPLVKAVQELHAENEELKRRLAALESKIK